ncbi:Sorbitol dehydrogenase [Portunus trituberculatus]|uniref:Sorbitol dehydrogenase n=1 Tax=Portunus trituberculatus TaxID=210409 RepID=A0A5B7CJA4_PORTR|nr:Sorbitol dehydrogenase [Portunus trituberculatus]
MDNTVVTLHGVNDLRMEKLPVPEVDRDEVLIRVTKVGLCGSDLCSVYKGTHGDLKIGLPCGMGHEAAGVVTKCGQDVTHVKPESAHRRLPDSVSDEEGAVVEPLAVAVHACRRAVVWAGCNVLVTGAGPIGLLCLSVAKALGATNILITGKESGHLPATANTSSDIKESRLTMAKQMGADHTLLATSGDAQSQAQQVQQIMGCQPDITMECSGTKAGLTLGIYVTKSGGKLVQVGVGPSEVTVPLTHAAVREVDILGVYRYVNCFPIAIDLLAKKLVDVKPLITHRFNFEEFQKAFDMFHSAEDGAVKCMISC